MGGGGVVRRGGWVAREGVKPSVRTQTAVLCLSLGDRKGLNPQDRPRQSLVAVWHQSHVY